MRPNRNNRLTPADEVAFAGDSVDVQLGGRGGWVSVFAGRVRFAPREGLVVTVRLALAQEGPPRLVCTGLDVAAVPGANITGGTMAQRSWGGFIFDAARHLTRRVGDDGQVGARGPARATEVALANKRRPGRPGVEGSEYERAAQLYRRAQAAGRPTTAAVAEGVGVSMATARKRVHEARRRGLLPPAESTRPKL